MPALIPVPDYPFSIPDRFRSLKANVNPEIVKLVLQHPHYSVPNIDARETWYTPEVDDISSTNRDKRTALLVLCTGSGSSESAEAAKMLIAAGANVNHQDENKLTPLHLAAGAESLPSATEDCSASDQPVHFAAHETDLVKVDKIPKFAQIVSQTRKSMKNRRIWYIFLRIAKFCVIRFCWTMERNWRH
jgi:hypothetical protein